MKNLLLTILFILPLACFGQTTTINLPYNGDNKSFTRVDTLINIQDSLDYSLIVFSPQNCNIAVIAHRPDSANKDIKFCAPAAFTAKNYRDIVGKIVSLDTVIENQTEKETGFCFIDKDRIFIDTLDLNLSNKYFSLAKKENKIYFQQMLLLLKGREIPCKIFGKQKPTFRRALVTKQNNAYVVESLNRLDIGDFTKAIKDQGYDNAIYMDMGSWSEGYYLDEMSNKIIIGRLRQNTKSQSNWLIFY